MTYELHHGDCIEVLASMPAESVDAIVTSPPYAEQRKSTYGGIPEKDYPAWTVAWMSEARRVIKPNGSVIINISTHARGGQLSDYVLRTRLAVRDAGWLELDEMIWWKSFTLPSAPHHKPQRSWESLLWYAVTAKPWTDPLADGNHDVRKIDSNAYGRTTAANRKWDHYDRGGSRAQVKAAKRKNIVKMSPGGFGEASDYPHPAPFNPELAGWCGRLICPPGGTILDPFSGSASTGVAAIRNGWNYIGIDAVQEYVDMSRRRLDAEAA